MLMKQNSSDTPCRRLRNSVRRSTGDCMHTARHDEQSRRFRPGYLRQGLNETHDRQRTVRLRRLQIGKSELAGWSRIQVPQMNDSAPTSFTAPCEGLEKG